MSNLLELTYCLCGELMKKEKIKDSRIPVCWKCQCNSNEELIYKQNNRKKNNQKE